MKLDAPGMLICASLACVAVGFLWFFGSGCYKGDPGYGDTNYPPEPPVTETKSDAGRDAR